MEQPMKRKQFHLTAEDDEVLKKLAKENGMSEAEIVRESIREYAAKNKRTTNPLIEMAERAREQSAEGPSDLSVNHDQYLLEIEENDK